MLAAQEPLNGAVGVMEAPAARRRGLGGSTAVLPWSVCTRRFRSCRCKEAQALPTKCEASSKKTEANLQPTAVAGKRVVLGGQCRSTRAILAQGTNRALAVKQAFCLFF